MKVRAYRNLNAGRGASPRWSIQIDGLVVATATDVHLTNCSFHVSAATLARVRREGVRAVCAWVEGDLIAVSNLQTAGRKPERTVDDFERLGALPTVTGATGYRVRFNPFNEDHDTFVTGNTRIDSASTIYLTNSGSCMFLV